MFADEILRRQMGASPPAGLLSVRGQRRYKVVDSAAMLALPARRGDQAELNDGAAYELLEDNPTTLESWQLITSPVDTYVQTGGDVLTGPLEFVTGEPLENVRIGARPGAFTPVFAVEPGTEAPANAFGVIDLLVKGNPVNYPGVGVVWFDICSSTSEEVAEFVYQAIRIGKQRGPNANGSGAGGYGYVSVVDGDGDIGNNAINLPLVLQNLGGPVGITSSPHSSAQLDVPSTTKGFLPPRMTTAQRDAIASPAEGLTIYNNTTKKLNFYDGTSWRVVTST